MKIAKKLKKNNVAVDIVSFGSEDENAEKLEAFHGAVNSNDNSHLVTVPVGTILSDMLFSTPIFMEEGAGGDGGEAGAPAPRQNIVDGFDYGELGVDPTLDPELALALRVSMEEERARQAAATAAAGGAAAGGEGAAAETPAPAAPEGQAAAAGADEEGDTGGVEAMDEDELLQQALALSMQVEQPTPEPATFGAAATPAAPAKAAAEPVQEAAPAVDEDAAMLEVDDPELALALQMSMAEAQPPPENEQGDAQ